MDAGVLEVLTEFGLEGFAATIAAQLGVSKAAVRTLRTLMDIWNSLHVSLIVFEALRMPIMARRNSVAV